MNSHHPMFPQPSSEDSRRTIGRTGRPPRTDPFESGFQKLKTCLHRELIDSLDLSRIGTLDEAHLRSHWQPRGKTLPLPRQHALQRRRRAADRRVDGRVVRAGTLDPYMQDPDVTDIMVNGPNEVYVERSAGSRRPTRSSPTKST